MAALVALCSGIGRKNLTTAAGCFTDRGTQAASPNGEPLQGAS
uniref:Mitochondrial ribosomal protein S18C n=1 Tax=Mus musculus TaxID=10090 RepID=A0A0G2JFG7_MOUSE